MKLEKAAIQVWADKHSLQPGDDWKLEIDRGIDQSQAIIVVLSEASTTSSYVTYEWASSMGKHKPIIPVLISNCIRHPKIEAIQHIDFSSASSQPWDLLIRRIQRVFADYEGANDDKPAELSPRELSSAEPIDYRSQRAVEHITAYLNERGFRMVSFERIRSKIDASYTDEWLENLIVERSDIFRPALLERGRRGLALR